MCKTLDPTGLCVPRPKEAPKQQRFTAAVSMRLPIYTSIDTDELRLLTRGDVTGHRTLTDAPNRLGTEGTQKKKLLTGE